MPETTPQIPRPQPQPPKTTNGGKKPPRKITTCVDGALPEEYFSFPTIVITRRGRLKKVVTKAKQGLQSVFTSLKRKFR
ncbi:uncharacterized protein N7479_010723 [Penicillium vulpinum]|uniref:uncharacterized protein n=1 Tax=Penicillium vulpinum TaxID=29845 RepID=UPI002548153D|nr:uncharacterized protein N7479_010723 [Penicillium vulpinum]KAJ5952310.1 hypothetical protein N7479_010723 [Penicillium vulpinum]